MISSIVLLSVVLVCVFISVSGLPLAGSVTPDPILPSPFEDFSGSDDDFASSASQDDALNEIPKYTESSQDEKSLDFLLSLVSPTVNSATPSTPSPVESSTETIISSVVDNQQQFAQLDNGEYHPDPPVFDRNILLKLRKEGLLTRNV